MNILIINKNNKIPVFKYGGTQRDIWAEGKELAKMNHKVYYLVKKGSTCPFATIIPYEPQKKLDEQIPDHIDIVHVHGPLKESIRKKFLCTIHGNGKPNETFDRNTVFVSKNHAQRHGSERYVYNGLDLELLGTPDLNARREGLLFLAKISRKVKNLKGSIEIAGAAGKKLNIAGGRKFSVSPRLKYYGSVGGEKKNRIIQKSEALLFPVLWHEPLGLAILEAMYFGLPVFGTTYGSLPELVGSERGFISNSKRELVDALQHIDDYDRRKCHEFIADNFSAKKMTQDYLELFDEVLNGQVINEKPPKTLPSEYPLPFPMYD
jgi:glycosyltransferase involved in cell wall biosynthesis